MHHDYADIAVRRDATVTTIALDRPEVLNAITPRMLDEMHHAIAVAGASDTTRVIVITGTGRAFSAGVDLKALDSAGPVGGRVGDALDAPARLVTGLISTVPKPVVAAVNGHCFTGALELALACDIMVVADEATIGDTHARFGLRPTWGMSVRLPRAVGIVKARELSLTAAVISGAQAVRIGLAARSAPREDFDAAVAQLCAELVANSPGSLAAYKDLYRSELVRDGLEREVSTHYDIDDTSDRLAGFSR